MAGLIKVFILNNSSKTVMEMETELMQKDTLTSARVSCHNTA